MKKSILVTLTVILCMTVWLSIPSGTSAQKYPKEKYPTLRTQLSQSYLGENVQPDSPLAELIAQNQDFDMLRADEFNDKRGLPPWLRVWWRKQHPESLYTAEDPTKGYPLVLKEILEWMISHQDLKPGPGISEESTTKSSPFIDSLTIGTNVRTSGAQTAARSESYIQINFFDPNKILATSNNISASGQQGAYSSIDGGVTWTQSLMPLTSPDSFHSDPTADFTDDGRAWSATLGISGSTLRLRNYFSTDNGATWTLDATPSGSQTNVDKEIVWVDKSATSPFFGQMYAIWHNGTPAFMNRRTAGASGTWLASPLQVSGAESTGTAIGGDVKSNSAGDVFGFWPTTGNAKIFVTKSTNGGASFGTPVQIATTFDTFDTGVPSFNSRRALIYVSGAAYKTVAKDNVYATWADLSGETGCTSAANEPGSNVSSTCKMRIWFSRSTDGGATWSPKVMINNQASLNDQFNQWLALDDTTGVLGVMYYDTVGDAGRKKTDVWFQTSFDDGATWTTAEKVTSAMTDETNGGDSGNQYGDYNGMSGYGNSFFPSWTDRRNNANEEIWTALISIGPPPPPAPIVASTGVTYVSENGTPGNNVPDPGETVTVGLGLHNIGNAISSTVTATLQPTGGVTNPSAVQNYGVLTAGGATVTNNFTFTVNPGAACGGSITLTFSVQDGANTPFNVTKTYNLGTPAVSLSQNFDGVTAPALPAGWTTTQDSGTTIVWGTTATGPNSAPNSAFANDPSTVNMSSIVSPPIAISSASAQLKFKNKYATESTFDGMVLEISNPTVNAGAYQDIINAGGSWVSGGYNATISTSFSSPIAGRQAWSGSSGSYIDTVVNLPANANGNSVQFRWRMASDSSVASTGVNVDDVQVLAGNVCATVPNSVTSRADFDGDGKTDLSVFRPSEGNWYLNRSTAGFTVINWGISSDALVPGDYDGDGKADTAIFRPSPTPGVPDFYVLNSNGFTYSGVEWGTTGDSAVAGDYDGDGKTDFAIFRPSEGTWYILNSSNGSNTIEPFGQSGDMPMAMDSDGDGKTNLCFFRPSDNTWYIAHNTGVPASNYDAVPFGSAGDILVPADYDGDNKDDVAIFRPSNGTWYILRSSDAQVSFTQFGTSGDVPVSGDYDGDGKDDIAVYRGGTWYLNQSTAGFSAQAFGVPTDVPVPAAYHP